MMGSIALLFVLAAGCEDRPCPYNIPDVQVFQKVIAKEGATVGQAPAAEVKSVSGSTLTLRQTGDERWSLTTAAQGGTGTEIWALTGKEGAPWMMHEVLLGSFAIEREGSPSAGVFLYRINEGNGVVDLTHTFVVTCPLTGGKPLAACQKREIARTNLWNKLRNGTEWVYPAAEPGKSKTPQPGRKSDVRLLLLDVDGDGATDLVLWRRECRSMTIAEAKRRPAGKILSNQCDLDLVMEKEELLFMRYDKAKKQFDDPRPDERLVLPKAHWWREMPGLDAVAFWR
jgi:hypothetical protein